MATKAEFRAANREATKMIKAERRKRAETYARESTNLDELKAKFLVLQEEIAEKDRMLGRPQRKATELPNFLNERLEDQKMVKEELHREQSLQVLSD